MINPPWVRIPGFPDYAMDPDTAEIKRCTPQRCFGITPAAKLDADGTLPFDQWTTINPYCNERGLGQVRLMAPGGGRMGRTRSVTRIMEEIIDMQRSGEL